MLKPLLLLQLYIVLLYHLAMQSTYIKNLCIKLSRLGKTQQKLFTKKELSRLSETQQNFCIMIILWIIDDYLYQIVLFTVVTFDRKEFLIPNIELFKNAIKQTKEKYQFNIAAICVLKNHIHMLLKTNNIKDYPNIIKI